MDQDGENTKYLTLGNELVLTPRFNPTNQLVTYMSYFRNLPRVYLLDIETGIQEVVGNSSEMKDRFKEDIMKNKGVEQNKLKDLLRKSEGEIQRIDQTIESIIQSISSNEVNLMLGDTDKRIHKVIKQKLEEELGNLEDKKKGCVKEIDDLDNQKEWIDWIGKFGDETKKTFKKVTSEYLEGIVDEIVVSPSMGKDRDNKSIQVGHKFKMTFKLPIVKDSIQYIDTTDKSKGYNVVKGKKTLQVGDMLINKGGRGKKKDN
jgi:hypothetical protein